MKNYMLLVIFIISLNAVAQTFSESSVKVAGISKVKVIPDYALIDVSIDESDKTAIEAKKKHDVSVGNVLTFLKDFKFDKKAVATQYMSINKEFDYNTKEYKYTASQTISIRLDDLNKYEDLIQGLFEAGVNRFVGIRFSSTKYEQLINEARKLAVKQAKQKAELYAKELHQNIGKAIFISEFNSQEVPYNRNLLEEASVLDEVVRPETIAIGEIIITGTIYITFELK